MFIFNGGRLRMSAARRVALAEALAAPLTAFDVGPSVARGDGAATPDALDGPDALAGIGGLDRLVPRVRRALAALLDALEEDHEGAAHPLLR